MEFSCEAPCSKVLNCGVHRCVEICHRGTCPPCRTRGVYRCQCGKVKEERECCDQVFRCDDPCEKKLSCGKHVCQKWCHSGECGECPLQGRRTCPCGKRVYEGMPCDDPMQVCGATCDKTLPCRYHRCHERCHCGQCIETCRIVVRKRCRCGSLKKDVPCYQDLACERKCLSCVIVAGIHVNAAAVMEIVLYVQRRLRCRNHKCQSPCHRSLRSLSYNGDNIVCMRGDTF